MSDIFLDERVLNYSEDVLNKIRIGPVEGILKEPLQISVEANWENIFNVGGSLVSNIQKFANIGVLNTGIWSRKFYKGGSYLRINPKMRVVNWDGDNNVIFQAKQLTDLALPLYKGQSVEKFFDTLESGAVGKAVKQLADGVELLFDPKTAKAEFHKLINDLSSNSPKPVDVVVSNFFRNTFIVESVQVEFSKEMTTQGPLYVDFEVVLSTPEVTLRGGTGLKSVPSRFTRS